MGRESQGPSDDSATSSSMFSDATPDWALTSTGGQLPLGGSEKSSGTGSSPALGGPGSAADTDAAWGPGGATEEQPRRLSRLPRPPRAPRTPTSNAGPRPAGSLLIFALNGGRGFRGNGRGANSNVTLFFGVSKDIAEDGMRFIKYFSPWRWRP
eukprot:7680334-Pyramimonas_sp.AAC.1